VQFTFYQPDGSMTGTTSLLNPVVYHIPPKGRFSLPAAEIFGGKLQTGWIQATSSVSGLAGQVADTFSEQVIPLVIQGGRIQLTNPGTIKSDAILTFYDTLGREIRVRTGNSVALNAHSQSEFPTPVQATSVRVSSEFPVSAGSLINIGGKLRYVQGQAINVSSMTRIVALTPSNGIARRLFLTNPVADPITISVSLVSGASGSQAEPRVIPGYGSLRIIDNSGVPGYIRIDSNLAPLAGVLELNSGTNASAIPLQAAALDQL